jgi:hypothetical protein
LKRKIGADGRARAGQFDPHLVGPYFIGTLATAAFGAFAGAWAASRRETKRAVVAELNSVAAARMLTFSICNKFLGLKRQHILPTYTEYRRSREEFMRLRAMFERGEHIPIPEFRADLRTISPIWVPTQSLERQVFEKISIRGRALAAAVDLVGATDGLEKSIRYREELISEIKQQSPWQPLPLALKYYGLRTPDGVIDERFQSNLLALHAQTDDCIFFARTLGENLFEYGSQLRRRNAWKFAFALPKMARENWAFAEAAGLLPDPGLYENWLRGFPRPPNRLERWRRLFRIERRRNANA